MVQKTRSLGESLAGTGGAGGIAAANKVKRGDVRHAIIVRTKKKVQRKDGMVVRFDDNACALIGKNGEPLGTRINGKSELHYDVRLGPWVARLKRYTNMMAEERRPVFISQTANCWCRRCGL